MQTQITEARWYHEGTLCVACGSELHEGQTVVVLEDCLVHYVCYITQMGGI